MFPERCPVPEKEPQYKHQHFSLTSEISFKGHTQKRRRFETGMEFSQEQIMLDMSCIRGII